MVVLSQYPGALDAYSRRTDLVDLVMAADPNELQAAVENIESTLGVNPQGGAPTVVERLDRAMSSDGYTITPQTALLVNGGYPTGATIDSSGNLSAVGNGTFGYTGLPVKLKVFGQAEIGTAGVSATGLEAVAIGNDCIASGDHSFATGDNSHAHGEGSVAMGDHNQADVDYTIALGRQAQCSHIGTFVWADSTNANFPSILNDQFSIRAAGGVRIVTAGGISDNRGLDVTVTGGSFTQNTGLYANISGSIISNRGLDITVSGGNPYGGLFQITQTDIGVAVAGIVASGTGSSSYAMQASNNASATTNFGLYAEATGSGTNWAIYAASGNNYFANRVGIGVLTPLLGMLNVACSSTAFAVNIQQTMASTSPRGINISVTGATGNSNFGISTAVSGGVTQNTGESVTITGASATNIGLYSDVSGGTINYDLFCNGTNSFIKYPYATSIPTAAAGNGSTTIVADTAGVRFYLRAVSQWVPIANVYAENTFNLVLNSLFEKMSGVIPNDWSGSSSGTGGSVARAANTMSTRGQYMATITKNAGAGYYQISNTYFDTSTTRRLIPFSGTRRVYAKCKCISSVAGYGQMLIADNVGNTWLTTTTIGTSVETLEGFADIPSTAVNVSIWLRGGDGVGASAATVSFSEIMVYEGYQKKAWSPNPVDVAGYYV